MKASNKVLRPARIKSSPFRRRVKAIVRKPSGGCYDEDNAMWVSCNASDVVQGQGQGRGQQQARQPQPGQQGQGQAQAQGQPQQPSQQAQKESQEMAALIEKADSPDASPREQKLGKTARTAKGLFNQGAAQIQGGVDAVRDKLKKADEAVKAGMGKVLEGGAEQLNKVTGGKMTGAELLWMVMDAWHKLGEMYSKTETEVASAWSSSTGISSFAVMLAARVGGWLLSKAWSAIRGKPKEKAQPPKDDMGEVVYQIGNDVAETLGHALPGGKERGHPAVNRENADMIARLLNGDLDDDEERFFFGRHRDQNPELRELLGKYPGATADMVAGETPRKSLFVYRTKALDGDQTHATIDAVATALHEILSLSYSAGGEMPPMKEELLKFAEEAVRGDRSYLEEEDQGPAAGGDIKPHAVRPSPFRG